MSSAKRKGSTGGLEAPPSPNSANLLSFPRSTSPSGFQGFLTKSARWLSRTTSNPKPVPHDLRQRHQHAYQQPSTNSTTHPTRRPTISGPSDPRPILGVPTMGLGASQSVLDLSTTRVLDRIDDYESPTPSDAGDLNVTSSRAWSRSVDDLSSFAAPSSSGPAPSMSNPSLPALSNPSNASSNAPGKAQIDQYRKGTLPSGGRNPNGPPGSGPVPFPSRATSAAKIAPPITTAPPAPGAPHSPKMSHSPSSPTFNFRVTDAALPPLPPPPPAEAPAPNFHARSKSHGAHHPSNKQQPTVFIPPSPPSGKMHNQNPFVHRRKASAEKEPGGKSHGGGAFSGLAGFPFHFGGGSSSSAKQNPMGTPPSSDAPDMRGSPRMERERQASAGTPTITVEAEPEPSGSSLNAGNKPVRNSQIIHCSGFINRFAKPSKFNGQGLASDKGWKAYKAQLVGTKLYFYKPPADRAAEIKDLFLTGPTPVEIMTKEPDAIAEVEVESGNGRGRGQEGRRKRVYWGRARHAELIVSEAGEVISGSSDALIHEMVFATAFKAQPSEEGSSASEPSSASSGIDETRWKEFAAAMLLFLPSYMEKPKFEAEVLRDLSSFDRGASEEEKADNAARLQWLLAEYLRLHGMAADKKEWRSLMVSADTPVEISTSDSSAAVPTITLSPSPNLTQSPTFANPPSPQRPGAGRPPVERTASNDSVARSRLAVLLAEEGLSRDTLSRLDTRKVGDSLTFHQRSQVGSEPILASDFFTAGTPTDLVSAFSGSDDRPHWLTRVVVEMVLGQVGKSEMKGGDDGGDGSGSRTSSSTYVRAGAVARWIRIGDRCLSNGDECSWKAIVAALCCIAIVRLEKVWKRVEESDRQTVEDWVKGEKKSEVEPVSVWFGDMRKAMPDAAEAARTSGQADRFRVAPLVTATKRLQDALRQWQACAAAKKWQKQPTPDMNALVEFWGRCRADPSPRLASINQILPLSFAIESRQRGQYQPYFWKPQPAHSAAQSILPLLFPEPLPTISLIDRNALIRTKKETLLGPVPGAEVNEAQVQKLTNPNARSKSRTPSRQRNIAEVDLDETLIPCFGGELVLKLPRDDGKSRPTSFVDSLVPNASPTDGFKPITRGNSIRLNTGSRLERKGSQMRLSRRSSLPSISQRNSLLIPEAPVVEASIRVTVKSGTLDRLVDVLVSGLDGVGVTHADDNGESPLRDGKSKSFKVDRAEFARVWWTGFRSFVTPLVLFELLRKRFVGGHATADPLAAALKRDSSPSGAESPAMTQLRLDVLSTLSYWFSVGGGAQDILDDLELYQSIRSFLTSDLQVSSPDVQSVRKLLLDTFTSITSLPVRDVTPPKEPNGTDSATHRFGSQPPAIDDVTAAELVSNLDSIAQTSFRGVTEASMFELADILETQTADRTGWFSQRDGSSHDDTIVIQDLYLHLQNVEPSQLIASGSQHEHLYRLLSPSLRGVIRAHNCLRDWLIFKLANPVIPYSTRLKRMELAVKAVEICRSRSQDRDPSSDGFDRDQPVVRSFIEATLVSAILSPECRAYARAWHEVAGSRNSSVEDMISLLSFSQKAPTKGSSLTVDPAWVMERMLEIITLPDVIERDESLSLINLEKRRFLHNLVVNTAGLTLRPKRATESERQDMERLSAMAREAHQGSYDYRSVREAAQRDMNHLSFNHGKRTVKPFYQLVALQQEKTKRDRYLRDKLLKEKRSEQLRSDKRASILNKAMQPNRNGPPSQKHVRQKRSVSAMSSLFRPLSAAFGATMERAGSWEGPRRSAAELDFPALKPKVELTMNLVGAGVRSFINDQRPFTIQLDLEDGGRFLLQTTSGAECNKWLQGIKKVAETSALRRLTYLGRNAVPAYNEAGEPNSVPKDPNGIFGKDILAVLQRESPTGEYIPGVIPRVVEVCLNEINKRGLQEPGLHRVAGSKALCNQLRAEFNSGRIPDLTIDGNYPDIHVIGDCLRQWLRELPEGIFTNRLNASFVEVMKIPDYDERKAQLRGLIWQLPQPNFDILRRLLEHLDLVVDNEEYNHMTPDTLAICFNVTLCKPSTLASFDNMQHTLSLVKHCILHYGYLFSEIEPEFDEALDEVVEEDEPEEEGEDTRSSSGPESPTIPGGNSPDQRGLLGSSLEANMTQTSFFTAQERSPVSPQSPSFDIPPSPQAE